MTDADRIKELLERHGAYTEALSRDLLELVIDIAGDKLMEKERVKAGIYRTILQNKMVKPEFMKAIYELMQKSEERLNG